MPPPPQVLCEPQGCVPKPCPEAAGLTSYQPDPELGALQDLPNWSGGTSVQLCLYHLWLRNTWFTTEPLCNLQSFFLLCKRNKATSTLRGPSIAAPLSLGRKTVLSQSAQTYNIQFLLDLVSIAVIFKVSKKDEEWLRVVLIWTILNWKGQTKVSLSILKASIQIAPIQLQIISQNVTPTEK